MEYLLNDDILKLKFLNGINQTEAILFYSWHSIHTISDLLKYGEEVRENQNLQIIIENFRKNNIKFDDELNAEELQKRNEEREIIEMKSKKTRSQYICEELLSREIESLNLSNEVIHKLKQRQIYTIKDLIDGSRYMFFQKDSSIFKESNVKRIVEELAKLGLHLNMINPINHEIDKRDEFKPEEAVKKIEPVEKVAPEDVKENQNLSIVSEVKEPEKRQTDMNEWDRRFEYLKIFKSYFGHIYIPKSFKCDGLGEWITKQRNAYKGTKGTITKDQIEKLESLGMSWICIGNSGKLKHKYYVPLNIRNVEVTKKEGFLVTYYFDGTKKSTNDEEFIDMLKGKIELPKEISDMMGRGESDSNPEAYGEEEIKELMHQVFEELPKSENDEDSLDTYSLMRKRIEEMKSRKKSISSENYRKKKLIKEYRELAAEFEGVTMRGLELDNVINSLLGIENVREIEETRPSYETIVLDDIETAKEILAEEISKKREDNGRKQELINEFIKVEKQLNNVQSESDKLDSQIASMLTPNNIHIKKRGES